MVMIAAVAVMAALVVVLSVVQAARYDHPRTTIAGAPAPLAVGTALQRPRPVPFVGLIDANGKLVSLNRWHGKWVVLAPSLTLCHEVCPMTTGALMQLTVQLRRAGLSKQVAVVEATVDPWRDTPARLRAYRRLSGADFPLLTGTQAAIHRLWKFFGVYYARVAQGKPPDVDWLTGKPETFDVNHGRCLHHRPGRAGADHRRGNAERQRSAVAAAAPAAQRSGAPQPRPSAARVDRR